MMKIFTVLRSVLYFKMNCWDNYRIRSKNMQTRHYKAFSDDMTCRDYQYQVGEKYSIEGKIKMCENGFHSCKKMLNCLNYYVRDSRFCEVEIGGDIITDGDKTVSSEITIVREITD